MNDSMTASTCPICGETGNSTPLRLRTSSRHFNSVDYSIVRCPSCCGCFWNPPFTLKDMQAYYGENYPEHIDRQLSKRIFLYKRRLDIISKYCSHGTLLDVGAGVGSFMDLARSNGWKVTGVEMSSSAVAMADKLYNISVQVGTLEDQYFPSDHFDVVHLNHVLEHVPSPNSTLKEIFRILKHGGVLVLEVPNEIDSLQGIIAEGFKKITHRVRESGLHLTFMNPRCVKSICNKTGFSELSINTYYHGCSFNFNRFKSGYFGGRAIKHFINFVGGLINKGPLVEYYGIK